MRLLGVRSLLPWLIRASAFFELSRSRASLEDVFINLTMQEPEASASDAIANVIPDSATGPIETTDAATEPKEAIDAEEAEIESEETEETEEASS